MKKILRFVLSFTLLCCLIGCGSNINNVSNKSNISINTSKISVDNFVARLKKTEYYDEIRETEKQPENPKAKFYDITPKDIADEIGCQIFKDGVWCSSYVFYKDEIYPIGYGSGVVDMKVCDFNDDGQPDILYTFSFGSGIHRWAISLFDFARMTETSPSFGDYEEKDMYMPEDVALEKNSKNEFEIYLIKWEHSDNVNFAKLKYTKGQTIGKVINENGIPKVEFNK